MSNYSTPSGHYNNPNAVSLMQTNDEDSANTSVQVARVCKASWSATQAATADVDAVHAAVTDTGSQQVITTGFTALPCPRNVTATSGGTAADIKAVQVTVTGTNANGATISETLPIFTENTATTVAGTLAFSTVTSWTLPAHDGTAATTSLGFGDKLGLPHLLPANTVLMATLAGTKEGTAPTVVADSDELEKNTMDLNSALNGTAVTAYYLLP